MSRARIAFFSPFNPQRSGVSDYSEELLPALSQKADVELVVDGYSLGNASIAGQFRVVTGPGFRATAAEYSMPVYQVANSAAQHGYMLPYLEEFPGVVVLHDYYLHHLMLGLTLLNGDFRAVQRILEPAHGSKARARAWGLLTSTANPYNLSLIGPLLDRARAIVTHSRFARDLVLQERPNALVRVIPMGMPEIDAGNRASIREGLGIGPSEFVLASVSTLSYTKRIEVVIVALALLQPGRPGLRLWILGGGQLSARALSRIRDAGLGDRVKTFGWTPAARYEELLVASDAVIDLRHPSGAETSASLLRAIAAGKPAIVSAQGSFLELPDEFTRKIPVATGEERHVANVIGEWMDRPGETAAMGEAARRYARSHMRLEQAAEAYLEVIEAARARHPTVEATPMSSDAKAAERFVFGTVYKACRAAFLLRTYGWAHAVQGLRQSCGGSPRA